MNNDTIGRTIHAPHEKDGHRGIFDVLLRPFSFRIRRAFGFYKYSHHSDTRSLDWDWNAIKINRIAVVNRLLALSGKNNPAYLEIGCASDDLFASVPTLNKVGVDPASGGTIRETSDRFFEKNTDRFDLVFIDGLHTYDQARRDIINSIKCVEPGGWIVLHDMLPRSWIEHHVPYLLKGSWTGDVWKVGFELAQTEGIDYRILKLDFGVGLFRVHNNDIAVKDLANELRDKEFSYYYENLGKLPIIEWEDAQAWLLNS